MIAHPQCAVSDAVVVLTVWLPDQLPLQSP